ncbi:hypothetical protein DPEC_G00234470 [Dallia pectoralis]|uniref:Uncharacterized protein n=1 Tax=Dallia pectoralis TaxID=75939 RepID=A0ACC2FXL8_DALPE|nr:hypothetical protein DPEC_G00234470 [Dallia pectoralis]
MRRWEEDGDMMDVPQTKIPLCRRSYPCACRQTAEEVVMMRRFDIVEESSSPWPSLIIGVPKADSSLWFCINISGP